ncbi:sulfite exporter TauE/SafE family protein [Aeromicrobium piscarium]|uniref:Probable membrane transporter protein n=1 Tax=Aeromicrobium piscarium TaxID=2590901 RepID=A0A554S7Z3_9ACTN|nr:sulfite exporter TauE/SafE family protein [Aeromicrobium piscarium]TSD62469.1 sulfite exporter TauE/SafE family protein [Aeromicrobium piscarium]
MSVVEMVLVLFAGVGAGVINTIVGSGTLITFPTLVAFGVPPVTATMSNAVGLIPGNISGSFGYRRELAGQGRRVALFLPASLAGALGGAWLLLHLPEDAFVSIVPWLLVLALVLVVAQPMLQRYVRSRGPRPPGEREIGLGRAALLLPLIALCGVYGGYFAAAQGILLVGILGLLLPDTLQRHNALKNILVMAVNSVAATTYVIVASTGGRHPIDWTAVGLIAAGSLVGGWIGARVGRRLPPAVLRACIVVLGLVAIWTLVRL